MLSGSCAETVEGKISWLLDRLREREVKEVFCKDNLSKNLYRVSRFMNTSKVSLTHIITAADNCFTADLTQA